MAGEPSRWRIWVDTGGTFTDAVARPPGGGLRRVKVLSSGRLRGRVVAVEGGRAVRITPVWEQPPRIFRGRRLVAGGSVAEIADWDRASARLSLAGPRPAPLVEGAPFEIDFGEEAPVVATRLLTGTAPGAAFPDLEVRLATTRGTNALLERRGADVALFVNRGFGDLLEIGTQQRPELFARSIRRPPPLTRRVVEVAGRLAADGRELEPLDLAALEPELEALRRDGIRAAAVALIHAYRNPEPERRLGALLARHGFSPVALSSALVPRIRLLPRAETAVVEAYLAPLLTAYLEEVGGALGAASVHVMTSAGGLVRAAAFHAKDSLLSGPAGGVVGAAEAARQSGWTRALAFDMGGTSTDVSRFDGEHDYVFETRVGPARLLAPALAIETVAAGGGSICSLAGARLQVGPESAGADPGPACYGAGGPLCLTDVNLLLGRLEPAAFGIPIDREAARRAAQALGAEVAAAGEGLGFEPLLAGLLEIANERMAEAVRQISIRQGYDPGDYALVAFGGAGGQHACALAALLGVATVLVPRDASLLSALGLGAARIERFAVRQVLEPLAEVEERLPDWLDELGEEARAAVAAEGIAGRPRVRLRQVELRLAGQDATLAVEPRRGARLAEQFEAAYLDHYGYRPPVRPVEVESLRVAASIEAPRPARRAAAEPAPHAAEAAGEARVWLAGRWHRVPRLERAALDPGAGFAGPALVVGEHTAVVVEPGWDARVDARGTLVLARGEVRRG